MAAFDDLLRQVPISQIAQKLGVDDATAEGVVKQALPTLLGRLDRNAQDSQGAESLAHALDGRDTTLADREIDMDEVDTNDGEKIVDRILGEDKDTAIHALAGSSGGGDESLVSKVLPMIAPIVMAYLAKQYMGSKGGLGGVLGSVLGGQQSQGGLGGMLGGLLGGGKN
ncbi:DUF937 domain-containing protein [Hoyosella sp. G463]|uniref:DUF937 domain-containing protein n=1 Tax=Lolliginicoccus lacisalsi TaxID=2742202 RepID=A0A927JAS0_9ACTN|nr:DUF937 domain-containing protein [Lolliginicoccus lacisalsi]MBD8505853.1 DUF937 domain-containing protein [Lolliginicoccus lacisalsi]